MAVFFNVLLCILGEDGVFRVTVHSLVRNVFFRFLSTPFRSFLLALAV